MDGRRTNMRHVTSVIPDYLSQLTMFGTYLQMNVINNYFQSLVRSSSMEGFGVEVCRAKL